MMKAALEGSPGAHRSPAGRIRETEKALAGPGVQRRGQYREGQKRNKACQVWGTERHPAQVGSWSVCSGKEEVGGKGDRVGKEKRRLYHEGPEMPVQGMWPLP